MADEQRDASPREQRRRRQPPQRERSSRPELDASGASPSPPPSPPPPASVSDVLGAVELGLRRLLATAAFLENPSLQPQSLLNRQGATSEDFYICTPAKLSSLRWRPDSGTSPTVAAGDYDGRHRDTTSAENPVSSATSTGAARVVR
ncbi:uncharacterized protein A4U43_C07F21710 [Asparagus officinalis]|uniref:Uncharacterized protein n=1 Tax=Asparagus officinalis TaxID=4686 RepID=A0A5P1EE58_ASPOF|nr:uncharacterized protein A4U43_C07F21710 [Asparagus officinalis]